MNKKIALAAVSALILAAPFFAYADTLNRQLQVGMSGSDVSSLQTFLAQDSTLYPEGLVTGYYGQLTMSAVQRFQARNGIVSSGTPASTGYGRVGPTTRAAINAQMAGGTTGTDQTSATISNVNVAAGSTGASISWATNESASGRVYYSTAPLTEVDGMNSVTISGATAATDTALHTSQSVSISNLQSNTKYYYVIYTTDQNGNVGVTYPATFTTTN